MLARILQARDRGLTIIFSRTKRTAAKVAEDLVDRGFAAAAIHGDLGQGAREQALGPSARARWTSSSPPTSPRGGSTSRTSPTSSTSSARRTRRPTCTASGRTARAGNTGVAITFVDWDDLHRWALINKALDLGIPEPQETYSTSEHLYADLDIPADAKGFLRKSSRPARASTPRRSRTSARPASAGARAGPRTRSTTATGDRSPGGLG